MARDDGESWLRGLPVRRSTSNPGSYERVIDMSQAAVSAALFVSLVADHRWLSALGALFALALVGLAASCLTEWARGRGPLREGSRHSVPWLTLVAVPLCGAAIYFLGTFARQLPLQLAGVAILALLVLILKLQNDESAS